MKKLIVAAFLAGSMVSMAEETVDKSAAPAAAPVAAAQPIKRVHSPLTPEQRAEMRARREKMMAERKAEMEKRAVEVIKKYGLDDEKAKALFNDLQEAMRPVRRPRSGAKPVAKPVVAPQAAPVANPVVAPAPKAE